MASTNRKLLQETPSISKYFKPVSITDHRMNNRFEELKDKLEKLREKQQEEAKYDALRQRLQSDEKILIYGIRN